MDYYLFIDVETNGMTTRQLRQDHESCSAEEFKNLVEKHHQRVINMCVRICDAKLGPDAPPIIEDDFFFPCERLGWFAPSHFTLAMLREKGVPIVNGLKILQSRIRMLEYDKKCKWQLIAHNLASAERTWISAEVMRLPDGPDRVSMVQDICELGLKTRATCSMREAASFCKARGFKKNLDEFLQAAYFPDKPPDFKKEGLVRHFARADVIVMSYAYFQFKKVQGQIDAPRKLRSKDSEDEFKIVVSQGKESNKKKIAIGTVHEKDIDKAKQPDKGKQDAEEAKQDLYRIPKGTRAGKTIEEVIRKDPKYVNRILRHKPPKNEGAWRTDLRERLRKALSNS